jgi:hypothetical protein
MSGPFIADAKSSNGVVTLEIRGGKGGRVVVTISETSIVPADPADIDQGKAKVVAPQGSSPEMLVGLLRQASADIEAVITNLTV